MTVVRGTLIDVVGAQRRIALDRGGEITFDVRHSNVHWQVGWRVLVEPDTTPPMMGLDLSAIELRHETASFDRVERKFAELVAQGPLSAEQYLAFEMALGADPMMMMSKAARQFRERVERTRRGDDTPLTDEDPWAAAARAELPGMTNHDAWLALVGMTGDGSKPTKKWNTTALQLVTTIGVPAFVETVQRWFALVAPRPVVRDASNWYTPAMGDANSAALRNLVWACAVVDAAYERETEQLAVAVGNLAVRCFTKIPNVGALSTKAGNACIYVLSRLPGMRAVSQLSRLSARVRYAKALQLVEKALIECAVRAGVEPIDLEELALPTFGLDVTGRARTQVGGYTAELAIVGDEAVLAFFDGAKRLKSVPAAVKSEHAEELKELKATHKELAALVPTLRYRLERWLVEPRTWALADLHTRYLDHPLAASLARRLIYVVGDRPVIFVDGYPIDASGAQVPLADEVRLALWHPLGRPPAELDAWRALFASLAIEQPIKQLDRELYLVAPSELEKHASSRFANRRVRQHQLAALCRERGWSYRLQGAFDSANSPTRVIPAYGLEVSLEVVGTMDLAISDAGIYVHVETRDVSFRRNGRRITLGEVPARCFSETMRDIDLFVTAT